MKLTISEKANLPMGHIGEMSSGEWARKYAPFGYAYFKQILDFETLDRAMQPAQIISITMDRLRGHVSREVPSFDETHMFTFISVFPKETGETVNRIDPLLPRLGIEIEVRYPLLVIDAADRLSA